MIDSELMHRTTWKARMTGPDSGTWSQSSLQQNAECLAYHSRRANGLPRALSERYVSSASTGYGRYHEAWR
jgi:hypothetical protein